MHLMKAQRPKRCEKQKKNKDENDSPNVNNDNFSAQKFTQKCLINFHKITRFLIKIHTFSETQLF